MTFGYDFSWLAPGGYRRVHGHSFATKADADLSFGRALGAFGYTVPKWWQFWRWSEPRPSVPPARPRQVLKHRGSRMDELAKVLLDLDWSDMNDFAETISSWANEHDFDCTAHSFASALVDWAHNNNRAT